MSESNTTLPNLEFLIDVEREEEGAWFSSKDLPTAPEVPGLLRVKVCSQFTETYQKDVRKIQTKAVRMSQSKRMEWVAEEIRKLAPKHLVMDWEMVDGDGNKVPFGAALCKRLYLGPEGKPNPARRFVQFVDEAVSALQGDLEDVLEEDEGN